MLRILLSFEFKFDICNIILSLFMPDPAEYYVLVLSVLFELFLAKLNLFIYLFYLYFFFSSSLIEMCLENKVCNRFDSISMSAQHNSANKSNHSITIHVQLCIHSNVYLWIWLLLLVLRRRKKATVLDLISSGHNEEWWTKLNLYKWVQWVLNISPNLIFKSTFFYHIFAYHCHW